MRRTLEAFLWIIGGAIILVFVLSCEKKIINTTCTELAAEVLNSCNRGFFTDCENVFEQAEKSCREDVKNNQKACFDPPGMRTFCVYSPEEK